MVIQFLAYLFESSLFLWFLTWAILVLWLLILAAVTALVGAVSWFINPSRTNCVFYAVQLWMTRGGYLLLSWSPFTGLPHVRHTFDLQTYTEFMPSAQKRIRIIPPIVFDGTIREWFPPKDLL